MVELSDADEAYPVYGIWHTNPTMDTVVLFDAMVRNVN